MREMEQTGPRHFAGELEQMQSLPLDAKIAMTKRRIREWYDAFCGNVYVSFSGGKDSTVLLHIARQMYPEIPAVFCDTGLEYPEIREFVKTVENVTWLKPEMNFRQVIQKYGYPVVSKVQARYIRDLQNAHGQNEATVNLRLTGYNRKGEYCPTMRVAAKWKHLKDAPFRVSDQCCDVMKKHPLKKYARETGRKPITATMCVESTTRERMWKRYGCNAFGSKEQKSAPLSFWTEQDILQYLKAYNVPFCPVYGQIVEDENGRLRTTGCSRTGCMFCMFGVHLEKSPNRFERMKETHPNIHHYCMKPVAEGGLGLAEVLDYIGVEYGRECVNETGHL